MIFDGSYIVLLGVDVVTEGQLRDFEWLVCLHVCMYIMALPTQTA